jgi:ABC-2 type transport system permease protein
MMLLVRGIRSTGTLSRRRVWAITRKELREYRRNRSVLVAMTIFPFVFLAQPLISIFLAPPEASGAIRHTNELLYLLGVPILVPATLAAYAVSGERQQGSLEPILTTPITREEFILGKAVAVISPSVIVAYIVYAVFLAAVALFAHPDVSAAILQGQDVVVQIVFTPLLAAAATWIGLAISTRTSDIRVAQQLSILGNLPLIVGAIALAFDVVHVTTGLLVVVGVVIAAFDLQAWRMVAPMFDRERLITGTHS